MKRTSIISSAIHAAVLCALAATVQAAYLGGTVEHGNVVELDEKNNTSAPKVVATPDEKD